MRYVACLLCALCAHPPALAAEEQQDRYEEQLVGRCAVRRVEHAWQAERGERSQWVREWVAAFPGKGPGAGEDPGAWFAVLADGGDEWSRKDAAAAGLGAQYDRLVQRLELGPVPSIRRDEFQRFARQLGRNQPQQAAAPASTDDDADKAFRVLDLNRDGELTRDELSTPLKDEKGRVDTNGDGRISKEEYREYFKKRVEARVEALLVAHRANEALMRNADGRGGRAKGGVPAWFDTLDTDKDSQISLYEWRMGKHPIEEFAEMDLNGDGLLTREEYLRYVKQNEESLKKEKERK